LGELTDEDLVRECQSSDGVERRGLANELFRRYYEKVGRWCYRFTADKEAAADLAQDVFVKAYRHLGSFEGSAKFSTWLYVIARNECFNRAGSSSAKVKLDGGDEMLQTLPDETALDPYEQLERASSNDRLRALLNDTLDDTERRIFTLHYGDDVPLETLTRLLGLRNASGAKAYIVSARRKLAKAVQRLKAKGVRP
jgi:RNA polymerase sigma-70 factor, ECF subfamily